MRSTVLVIALAACGKSSSSSGADAFAPTIRIEGPLVVIEARCASGGSIEANGQHAYCGLEKPATLRFPGAVLGPGKHVLQVVHHHGASTTSTDLSIDVPAAATGPYVAVDKCVDDFSARDSVHLELRRRRQGEDRAPIVHGARAKVEIHATPNGKLTIGPKTVDVPASGEVEVTVDFTPAIMALAVDDFAVTGLGAKSPPLEVPYALDAGGKPLAGKLVFEQASYERGKLFHAWLHDIADGKVDRPAFTPPPAGARKTIAYLDLRDEIATTDRRGKVEALAYVAIIKETGRKEAGTCEFESSGKKTIAKRFGVDAEVTVTSLADGKVVATKAFPAPAGCPVVAMLDPGKPETSVIVRKDDVMAWLETLAKP